MIASTSSTVIFFMHRWSVGQTLFRQGLQSTSFLHDRMPLSPGTRCHRIGRAEDGNDGGPDRGSHMHRTRVIGDQEPAVFQDRCQLKQIRLSGQVNTAFP